MYDVNHAEQITSYIMVHLEQDNREILNGLRRAGLMNILDATPEHAELLAENAGLLDTLEEIRSEWDEYPADFRSRWSPEKTFFTICMMNWIEHVREDPEGAWALATVE